MSTFNRLSPSILRSVLLSAACVMVLAAVVLWPPAGAEAEARAEPNAVVRIATYNIEHFMRMFDQQLMPARSRDRGELFRDEEDLYEVAATIKLPHFDADIIGIQEGCTQEMLEHFNKEWLGGRYAFVRIFAGNTPGQTIGMLAKPGFEVLAVREDYHKRRDPVRDRSILRDKAFYGLDEDNGLFCRGPAFVQFKTPTGQTLWVGVTHVKSKYGNNEAVTKWRIREMQMNRKIVGELLEDDPDGYLVMMGDFNDPFGMDRYEKAVGTDAVAVMLAGEGREKLLSPSAELARRKPDLATYHCKIKPPKYRSFIDHVFCSPALAERVTATSVIDDPIAVVASDHLPVMITVDLSEAD